MGTSVRTWEPMFSVGGIHSHGGEHILMLINTSQKNKNKNTYTSFEFFSIKECEILIEVLEPKNKNDKIVINKIHVI
jgi:hypothetical protein